MFMSTSDYELIGRSPRALTGVSARGLENWRSTPGQPEEREKWRQYRRKSNSHAHPPPYFIGAITAISKSVASSAGTMNRT